MTVDLARPAHAAIKTREQAVRASGDRDVIGATLRIAGENLCEAADPRVGDHAAGAPPGSAKDACQMRQNGP